MYLFNYDLFGAIAGDGVETANLKKKVVDLESSKKQKAANHKEKKSKMKSTDKVKGEKVHVGKKVLQISHLVYGIHAYCLGKKSKGKILATYEGASSDTGKQHCLKGLQICLKGLQIRAE